MIKYEIKSDHKPEVWKKLWRRRVVELNSDNKSAYADSTCYFGTIEGNELMVYFHQGNDGGHMTTRFMGRIESDGRGSKITGVIGKMKTSLLFLAAGMIFFLIGAVGMILSSQFDKALLLLALAVVCYLFYRITPTRSVDRLKRLLAQISVDSIDLLDE